MSKVDSDFGEIYVCKYCGEDIGKFNEETGNHPQCEELAAKNAELSALREKLSEEEKRNELFSDCLRRGLKLWQAENPDKDYWISGDENIKWMLDQIAALRERVEALEANLQFVVNNENNFTEHDRDGVIRAWVFL